MLDLVEVNQQIARMAAESHLVADDMAERLALAVERLHLESTRWQDFVDKISMSKTSWLVATIHEPLNRTYGLPPRPDTATVVAADGSQIMPSHHEVVPAFLLNIATVVLNYGNGGGAAFTSTPSLFYRDEDLYLDYGGERVQVTGDLLSMRRTLMEFSSLIDQAITARNGGNAVCALSDGSLILWQLEGRPPDYQESVLTDFLACLERGNQQGIPVIGYISRPRSRDVVNALRVGLCPEDVPNYDHCPYERNERPPCAQIEGLTDRRLFAGLLKAGERSQVFGSSSRILSRYGAHRIGFFYLHVGSEIVRIELPQWVGTDPALLDLVHALAYDQAQKGMGYPVALAEAHQQAVVRGAERDLFYDMVSAVFRQRGAPLTVSPKALRKRRMTV
jgi:hypothetical protein